MLRFFEWLKERIADAVSSGITEGAARGVSAVTSSQVILEESPPLLENNGQAKPRQRPAGPRRKATARK